MGEETGISWTDHTWSAWRGCARVSEACKHCYAETLSHRNPKTLGVWGFEANGGTRVVASPASWRKVLGWNEKARKAGKRRKIFMSLCDPFEDFPGLDEARLWLWALIEATPWLDWMLLTKRPENVRRMAPAKWVHNAPEWPANAWFGFTAETQQRFDERWEHAKHIPASVVFVSIEPQLGPIDLAPVLRRVDYCRTCLSEHDPLKTDNCPECNQDSIISVWGDEQLSDAQAHHIPEPGINWHRFGKPGLDLVICGGESIFNGWSKSRPMHPEWPLHHALTCDQAGVAYHFKQWGDWRPATLAEVNQGVECVLVHRDGTTRSLADGEVMRQSCEFVVAAVGKKVAGHTLPDGRVIQQGPESTTRSSVAWA